MFIETLWFWGSPATKKSPKKAGNAVSDALLMWNYEIFADGAAQKAHSAPHVFLKPHRDIAQNSWINELIKSGTKILISCLLQHNLLKICDFSSWPQKQWFSSHSMTPCRFLEKYSIWEIASLVSVWSRWGVLITFADRLWLIDFSHLRLRLVVDSIFFWIFCLTFREHSKHCHWTRRITFSRNHLVHVLTDFGYPQFLYSTCLDYSCMLELLKS